MKSFLLLFPSYLVYTMGAAPTEIAWKPYTLKYTASKGLDASEANVAMPAIWPDTPVPSSDVTNGKSSTISVHLRRIQLAGQKIRKVAILLEGGPGANANLYEKQIGDFFNLLGKDTLFVLYDHRGVGKSSKVMSGKDEKFRSSDVLSALPSQVPYPLPALTTINAAFDVVAIAKLVAKEQKEKVKLILLGSSYGTLPAMLAAKLDPSFDRLILEGLVGFNRIPQQQFTAGRELIDNCTSHPKCNASLGPNPYRLFNLIPELVKNPKRNTCSDFFSEHAKKKAGPEDKWAVSERLYTYMRLEPQKPKQGDLRLVLALLLQLESCTDLGKTKEMINILDAEVKEDKMTAIKEVSPELNSFALNYIYSSNVAIESLPQYCMAAEPPALLYNRCAAAKSSLETKDFFSTYLGKHFMPADSRIATPLVAPNLKVLILQGDLDYVTSLAEAHEVAKRMNVKSVQLRRFRNRGHTIIGGAMNKCVAKLVADAFGEGSKMAADDCLATLNSKTLIWDEVLPFMPATGPKTPLPSYALTRDDGNLPVFAKPSFFAFLGLGDYLWWVLGGSAALLLLLIILVVFLLVRRRRQSKY